MKHKKLLIAVVGLIGCAAAFALLVGRTSRGSTSAMLSLVGYTNDAGLHSAMYCDSSASNARIAIFAVTNQTGWRTFMYWRGSLQVKGPDGWVEDTHTQVTESELTSPVGPNQSRKIAFPVPDGAGVWRCSVKILDISYSKRLPLKWQERIRRAGVNLERCYEIWTVEIVR